MGDRYESRNRRKYRLQVHVVLVTKHRKKLLEGDMGEFKQRTTRWLRERWADTISGQHWKKHIFWSDGYFACSVGEVSSATVKVHSGAGLRKDSTALLPPAEAGGFPSLIIGV